MAAINFTGIASGIDSASLIQSLIDTQRRARIVPLETKVESLTEQNDSYSELKGLLNSLKNAASSFREVNGGAIGKKVTSSDDSVVSATASKSASAGTYNLTVSSLAKNGTASFTDTYASTSSAVNAAVVGTELVTIKVGNGSDSETIDVSVTSSTTLDQFVSAYNAASSKGTASIVNTGTTSTPAYKVVINSNETGLEDGSIVISDPANVFTASSLDQATDAEFTIDGIGTITRSSNTITDVFSGVSLNLSDTGSSTITIGVDSSSTVQSLQGFVDAYNEVISFIAENDTISREEDGSSVSIIYGPLALTSLDENVLSSLRSALSGASISGGTVNTFADLGVTTKRDGTLGFDAAIATAAIAEDPERTGTILSNLGEDLASVGGTIEQYTRYAGLIESAVTANTNQISNFNSRISTIEGSLNKQQDSLTQQFSRLEALIGKLNSTSSALSSLLR